MRKIVMFNRITADGYFAGADGNLDWVVPDDELDQAAGESTKDTDTILFGRTTYQMFESYWPKAVGESGESPDPHAPGRKSKAIHDMAVWINEAKKIVFSRTLKNVTWKNSRVIPEIAPRTIESLKAEPGKDMIVFGSGSVVSELTRHGLIDAYLFIVSPVLLGNGRMAITGLPKTTRLELQESKAFPSGNVRLIYARKR